jgi:MFS family permease
MSHMLNVRKLYAIRFFYNLIPAYVIERLFWEARGMSIQMVVYTEIIFALTVVLLEVPTGIMADKWGRKHMMILCAFLGCIEFLLLLYAEEFWHFALVVFLAAIGMSASSGAETALLYDSLLAEGKESSFEKYLGRLQAVDIISITIAALCGSVLASHYGFEFNYWISFISMLVALFVTCSLIEPRQQVDEDEHIPIRVYLTASVQIFKENKGILLVLLSGMVTGAAISFLDEFWQIYLDRLDIPLLYFGLFSAATFLVRLPGNLFAYKLKDHFSYRLLILMITGFMTGGFIYISIIYDVSSLGVIFIICLFAGIIEPLAAGYLHHRVGSSMRATVGSFQSLGENVVLIGIGLGFGYFSTKWDIFGGYGFIACVCSVYFFYFLFASKEAVE